MCGALLTEAWVPSLGQGRGQHPPPCRRWQGSRAPSQQRRRHSTHLLAAGGGGVLVDHIHRHPHLQRQRQVRWAMLEGRCWKGDAGGARGGVEGRHERMHLGEEAACQLSMSHQCTH